MSMTFSRSINALLLLVLTVPLLAAGNVDKLIAGLDHPLWSARRDAAERLAATGSDGREAVPRLVESLGDVEPEVRRASARALGAVGRGSAEAVSSLVEALRDEDWVVRREAALSLQALQSTARMAVPALRDTLVDGSPAARKAAAQALSGIAPASMEALPELIESLHDEDWQTRAAAAHALGKLGEDGRDAVPALAMALRDPDYGVAEPVVESLSRIGAPAVPVLVEWIAGPGPRCALGICSRLRGDGQRCNRCSAGTCDGVTGRTDHGAMGRRQRAVGYWNRRTASHLRADRGIERCALDRALVRGTGSWGYWWR